MFHGQANDPRNIISSSIARLRGNNAVATTLTQIDDAYPLADLEHGSKLQATNSISDSENT